MDYYFMSIGISTLIVGIISLIIVLSIKRKQKRLKKFDIEWLKLMKTVTQRIEIDYQIKVISERDYEQLKSQISKIIKTYERNS